MKISVVIPAKDEESTVAEVIEGCRPHAAQIIVADGSAGEATRLIARRLGAEVVADSGRGKGAAIRAALERVTGDVVVFIDADGSHEPADIPRLVAPIAAGAADHVSASRLLGGSSELHGSFDEFFRLAGGALITTLINWRFGTALSESQNGFRAIRAEVARRLDLRERISTIEQEMVIKTLKRGYRMAEVPSHERARKAGRSHIKLSRVWPRYGYSLVKYSLT